MSVSIPKATKKLHVLNNEKKQFRSDIKQNIYGMERFTEFEEESTSQLGSPGRCGNE